MGEIPPKALQVDLMFTTIGQTTSMLDEYRVLGWYFNRGRR